MNKATLTMEWEVNNSGNVIVTMDIKFQPSIEKTPPVIVTCMEHIGSAIKNQFSTWETEL